MPDDPRALTLLAWYLATAPIDALRDGPEAVRLAERACGIQRHSGPNALKTLAAAYAETGRYPDAVRTARRALEQAGALGGADLLAGIAEALKRYEVNRPFRLPPARPTTSQAARSTRS